MDSLLLEKPMRTDSWLSDSHKKRNHLWVRRSYNFRSELHRWHLRPDHSPTQWTERLPAEDMDNLFQEFQNLYDRLSHVSDVLDKALLQLKENRQTLDSEKAEIAQIKRELKLG